MRLGAFLKKRFQGKSKSAPAKKPGPAPRRVGVGLGRKLRATSAGGSGRTSAAATAKTPTLLPAVASRARASARPVVEPASNLPTTQTLFSARGSLRDSMEAFLLDQRSPHTQRAYGKDL